MRSDSKSSVVDVVEGERLVVSPRRARRMLDTGNTRLYELLNAGELESYLDGRSRKIIVESIHRYVQRRRQEAQGKADRGKSAHGTSPMTAEPVALLPPLAIVDGSASGVIGAILDNIVEGRS
jgi:hypothetical protein